MDEKLIKKLFGLRIKQLRKNAKLTQFSLGEMIGIDQRQIAYIEGGNSFPTLKTLNKFANIFNCSLKELFDYEHLDDDMNWKKKIEKKLANMETKNLNLCYQIIEIIEKCKIDK